MRTVIRNVSQREREFNPFDKPVPTQITVDTTAFEEGVVLDVILDETHPDYSPDGYNVGAVKFRFLTSDMYKRNADLTYAFPMEANIQEYPLLNEVVVIFSFLNRFYYTRKLNLINRVTAQSLFNINTSLNNDNVGSGQSSTDYYQSQATPKKIKSNPQQSTYGKYFKDNVAIYRLKSFEGDLIVQGRFGNSIRFGSSNKTDQAANILLRAGQSPSIKPNVNSPFGLVIEDIDKDKSSVWIVSNQIVPITLSTEGSSANNKSITKQGSQFKGAQVIINSERIILNSKTDKIFLNAKNGLHLTSADDATIDASQNFKSYVSKDYILNIQGNKTVSVQNNIQYVAKNDINIDSTNFNVTSKKIHIGSTHDESQPLVLGEELRSLLVDLIQAHLESAANYVMTSMGPGALTPSVVQQLTSLLTRLQPKVSPILSQNNFVTRNNG